MVSSKKPSNTSIHLLSKKQLDNLIQLLYNTVMWLLTIVIIVNGGEKPTKFETRTYKTQKECVSAIKRVERINVYAYCDRIIK